MPTVEWIMGHYKCDEQIAIQALQGFENFLNWFSMSKLKVAFTEIEAVSEDYQFGGCNDLVLETDRGLAIGDLKTSNSIYPDYLIQISAYKHLWDANNPNQPITGGFHLLRFSKEHADFAHHYWSELDDAWEQFKLFRKAYDIDKRLKKRV